MWEEEKVRECEKESRKRGHEESGDPPSSGLKPERVEGGVESKTKESYPINFLSFLKKKTLRYPSL